MPQMIPINLLPTLDISLDNSDPGYTVIMLRRTTRIPPCVRRSSTDSALFPPVSILAILGTRAYLILLTIGPPTLSQSGTRPSRSRARDYRRTIQLCTRYGRQRESHSGWHRRRLQADPYQGDG